jgi:TonB-dependent receptor
MMQFALSGEHLLGKIKTDWGISYSKASEDRPQERYLEMGIKGKDISDDISDPQKPFMTLDQSIQDLNSNWKFNDLTEENQYTEDIDWVCRLNIEIPLARGLFKNSVKIGGKYRVKDKERDNDFFKYTPKDEDAFNATLLKNTKNWTKDDFMPGDKYDVGTYVTKEFVGGLDLTDEDRFKRDTVKEEYAGNFTASEKVTAGYLMLNQQLGNKLSAIVGARVEHTSDEGQGYIYDDDAETLEQSDKVSNNYTNVLPNLQLRYSFDTNTILRLAYTGTIARPGYFDLVPYREIEDKTKLSIGNPLLEPTTSSNIDIMMEKYFKSIGIISGGFFYKDIKDFIVDERHSDYSFEGTTWEKFKRPINGGDAKLWGLEFAAQRHLDFLPGFLKNFGVYGNYTYNHSNITDFNIEDRENEDLEMPGTPKHTLNASLSYETQKFTSRLSFNYASYFISEFDDEAFKDVYYDAVTYLDLNLTYKLKKHYLFYADFNNLLNQPLRYFQGKSDRTYQMEYYGMTFRAGVKVNF